MDAAAEFEAVAIQNNREGADADVLKRFDEKAWDNPVVRFADADGKDLAPRFAGDWTLAGLVRSMKAAMVAAKRPVPAYLALLDAELNPSSRERIVFAMG